jgi:hypothetical protein
MTIKKSVPQGGQSGGLPEISAHPRIKAHRNIRPGRGEGRRSKIASVSGALSGRMIYLVHIPGVLPPANFHQPAGLKNPRQLVKLVSKNCNPLQRCANHCKPMQGPLPPGGVFPFKAIQGYSKLFKAIQSIFKKKKDSFLCF